MFMCTFGLPARARVGHLAVHCFPCLQEIGCLGNARDVEIPPKHSSALINNVSRHFTLCFKTRQPCTNNENSNEVTNWKKKVTMLTNKDCDQGGVFYFLGVPSASVASTSAALLSCLTLLNNFVRGRLPNSISFLNTSGTRLFNPNTDTNKRICKPAFNPNTDTNKRVCKPATEHTGNDSFVYLLDTVSLIESFWSRNRTVRREDNHTRTGL